MILDNRGSPGIPETLARISGYDPKFCGEGKVFEAATLTCSHCKCAVVKNPLRTRERAHCFKCDHYVCDLCGTAMRQPGYDHMPFDRLVDEGLTKAAHIIL